MEHVIHLILEYRYLIIIPLGIVEGPALAMVCGLLLRLGLLSFWPVYLILMVADLVGDIMWYCVGYYGGEKLVNSMGKYFGLNEQSYKAIEKAYHKYHDWILIISKITMGLGLPFVILTTAGIVRVPFKRYMALNFLGQLVWTGGLLAIGYYLGNFYLQINKGFETVSFIGIFVVILVVFYGIGRFIRSQTLKHFS